MKTIVLCALLAVSVGAPACDGGSEVGVDRDVLDRIETLEARVVDLQTELDAARAAAVTQDELTTALTGVATEDDLGDFLTADDVSDFVSSADLSAYLTKAEAATTYVAIADLPTSLAPYLTEADANATFALKSDLDGFLTESDLGGLATTDDLVGYVTTEALGTTLAGYATDGEVAAATSDAVTTEDLDGYATDAELAAAVAGLVDAGDLNATLTDYALAGDLDDLVTEDELDTALTDYALVADLGDYVLGSELEGTLAPYVRLIRESTTLDVPGDHATVDDALDWLDGYLIANDAVVTIQVADGTYDRAQALVVDHPDGARIEIRGNPSDPSAVTFNFTGSHGVRVLRSRALRRLTGVTLVGDGSSNRGLEVTGSSNLEAQDVVVRGFGREGIRSAWGSSMWIYRALAEQNGREGFRAIAAAMYGEDITTRNNGHGARASWSSGILFERAVAEENQGDGFMATGASALWANDVSSRRNGDDGFQARAASAVELQTSDTENRPVRATSNGNNGFNCTDGSYVSVQDGGAIAENNRGSGFSAGGVCMIESRGAVATRNGRDGFWAGGNGYLSIEGLWLDNDNEVDVRTVSLDNNASGFGAWGGGVVNASGSRAQGNLGDGYTASGTAGIDAWQSEAHDNGGNGFHAYLGAVIHAGESVASENGTNTEDERRGTGYSAGGNSAIDARRSTSRGNVDAGLYAGSSSSISFDDGTVTGNGWVGVGGNFGSSVTANGADISFNASDGCHAAGAFMSCENANIWSNGQDPGDYYAELHVFWNGYLAAHGANVDDRAQRTNIGTTENYTAEGFIHAPNPLPAFVLPTP